MTAWIAVVSTAYCLSGQMADGSQVRDGSVASNGFPLGAELEIRPSPTGRRYFKVRDRIGWGTELDFWLPTCSAARSWGRRTVHIRRARWAAVLVPVGRGPAHHPARRVRRERIERRVEHGAAPIADQSVKQRLLDRPMLVVEREHERPDAGEQAARRYRPPLVGRRDFHRSSAVAG
jgi:3D (Asp-Asp-Asp) domain-containing protein